jgi:hypothetical protein
MHILCPHCRNPIEVFRLTPHEVNDEIGRTYQRPDRWAIGRRLDPGSGARCGRPARRSAGDQSTG